MHKFILIASNRVFSKTRLFQELFDSIIKESFSCITGRPPHESWGGHRKYTKVSPMIHEKGSLGDFVENFLKQS